MSDWIDQYPHSDWISIRPSLTFPLRFNWLTDIMSVIFHHCRFILSIFSSHPLRKICRQIFFLVVGFAEKNSHCTLSQRRTTAPSMAAHKPQGMATDLSWKKKIRLVIFKFGSINIKISPEHKCLNGLLRIWIIQSEIIFGKHSIWGFQVSF